MIYVKRMDIAVDYEPMQFVDSPIIEHRIAAGTLTIEIHGDINELQPIYERVQAMMHGNGGTGWPGAASKPKESADGNASQKTDEPPATHEPAPQCRAHEPGEGEGDPQG
jgi:hypothetical protein